MRASRLFVALSLAASLSLSGAEPLVAQNRVPHAVGDWMLRNLRPAGQPVIPLFDGWFRNPDNTFELCFGYHNLNTGQDVELPLGPDNSIRPASFDGVQPTHFDEVPEVYRRRFCVFTVHLSDLDEAPNIVWTLRVGGGEYSVPGSNSELYRMDEIQQSSRGNSAPLVQLGGVQGSSERRGRATVVDGTALSTKVGAPLPLPITVTDPEGIPLGVTRVIWSKHQGPGSVMFSEEETEVIERSDTFSLTTTATFGDPGEYLLRVQAVDWDAGNAFGYHCCWTNRYLRVAVTE
jgi:hypothetical protein